MTEKIDVIATFRNPGPTRRNIMKSSTKNQTEGRLHKVKGMIKSPAKCFFEGNYYCCHVHQSLVDFDEYFLSA
jgi:hypothetical protein